MGSNKNSTQQEIAPSSASPKVSVVMPVCNTREDYFRQAVASILNQDFGNFELIIIDDCSDAYVSEAAMSFGDSRIVFHRFDMNQGAAVARNWALDHAKGEYIAFFDSDDVAFADRLGKEAGYLDSHPEAGVVYSNAEVSGDHGEKLSTGLFEEAPEDIATCMILKGNCICMSSSMVRRSVIESNHCRFNKKYRVAQDFDFWLSLLGKTRFAKLGDRLVLYRYHSGNVSHTKKHLQISLGCRAQLDAINGMLGLSLSYFSWAKLQVVKSKRLSVRDLEKVLDVLCEIDYGMQRAGMWSEYARSIVQTKLRGIWMHSHGLAKQKVFLSHRFPSDMKLPLKTRLFCLITRLV